MSLKDKLEIGLKPDAPYRQDNLPDFQQDDPDCVAAAEPGDGPRQREARDRCDTKAKAETFDRSAPQNDAVDEAADGNEAHVSSKGGPVR